VRGQSWERILVVLSRWRVDVAWLGLLALPWAHPTRGSICLGLPALAGGVALRAWARGHLERGERVTITGPYAHVRHPLYVGSFLIALAFALMTHLTALPIVVGVAFVAMYVPKALREEAYLRRRFGAAYADYAARVGAVIPSRDGPRASAPTQPRFEWQRVIGHREWHTWIGVAALLAVLCGLAAGDPRTGIVSRRIAHRAHHHGMRASQWDASLAR
jgi:protein-S-isoprenylcysteine O-methyltransferase Ste14